MLPDDGPQIRMLKEKYNELLRKFDEVYRLLRADVQIYDMREAPPHYKIDHAPFKWYIDPTTGDLTLQHRTNNVWSDTGWRIIGDLTRPDW